MKLSKKPDSKEKKIFKIVKKHIKTEEQMFSFMLTYMGMMSIMLDFLNDTYGNAERFNELPQRTKYAIAQAIHHCKVLGMMVRDELNENLSLKWTPIEDDAWESLGKISDRMVFVVKELYKQLKKEGRL